LLGAQLQGASLDHAELQDAFLEYANLQGASLVNAQLEAADLRYSRLRGADLFGAELQAADLQGARLEGANLDRTLLAGATLNYAILHGASLAFANLQGADLVRAQLQVASLIETQLEGASLFDARLEGALLRKTFVWRTDPPSSATGAFVDEPEPRPRQPHFAFKSKDGAAPAREQDALPAGWFDAGIVVDCCNWSETYYAALKLLIEDPVPAGPRRDQALRQIATSEKPPYVADEGSAKAGMHLAEKTARSAGSYFNTLAKSLKEIGCAADGAPYVIGGLIHQLEEPPKLLQPHFRFGGDISLEAELAASFLDEARCPGARGLSEENRAKLREIRDRALLHCRLPVPRRDNTSRVTGSVGAG
jgi:Pentapeptide repeats (8 copies)